MSSQILLRLLGAGLTRVLNEWMWRGAYLSVYLDVGDYMQMQLLGMAADRHGDFNTTIDITAFFLLMMYRLAESPLPHLLSLLQFQNVTPTSEFVFSFMFYFSLFLTAHVSLVTWDIDKGVVLSSLLKYPNRTQIHVFLIGLGRVWPDY